MDLRPSKLLYYPIPLPSELPSLILNLFAFMILKFSSHGYTHGLSSAIHISVTTTGKHQLAHSLRSHTLLLYQSLDTVVTTSRSEANSYCLKEMWVFSKKVPSHSNTDLLHLPTGHLHLNKLLELILSALLDHTLTLHYTCVCPQYHFYVVDGYALFVCCKQTLALQVGDQALCAAKQHGSHLKNAECHLKISHRIPRSR